MSKSNYLEVELLKWCTGQANALGAAIDPHVELFTAMPAEDGTGGAPSARGRVSTAGKWDAPVAGEPTSVTTNAEVLFPSHGAEEILVGFAVYDAAALGNMLRVATFGANKTVAAGDPARFAAGALTFTES